MPAEDRQPWLHPAVQTMIGSFNHAYQVALGTLYGGSGSIGVSYYGRDKVSPNFEMEYFAFSGDANAVAAESKSYPRLPDERYILNVFHKDPSGESTIAEYGALGYQHRRTAPILSLAHEAKTLPQFTVDPAVSIELVTAKRLPTVSAALVAEDERIDPAVVGAPFLYNFAATWNGAVAGWTQLVRLDDTYGAYLNQLYVLSDYRGRGIGGALLAKAAHESWRLGANALVLTPSTMAAGFYARRGFQPAMYFSVFAPP